MDFRRFQGTTEQTPVMVSRFERNDFGQDYDQFRLQVARASSGERKLIYLLTPYQRITVYLLIVQSLEQSTVRLPV
jgi:hypothetical protein